MSSLGGWAQEHSEVSFIRTLILFRRAPPSWANHLPQLPHSNTITSGIRFQHGFWGTQTFSLWHNCFIYYLYIFLAFHPFSLPPQIPFSCLSCVGIYGWFLPSTPLSIRWLVLPQLMGFDDPVSYIVSLTTCLRDGHLARLWDPSPLSTVLCPQGKLTARLNQEAFVQGTRQVKTGEGRCLCF